jgi:rhodanese-related sulfurtransferase
MFFFKSKPAANTNLKEEIAANNGIILDVRTAGEQASGKLPGAVGADWFSGEFARKADQLDPNKHYYLYCRSGGRSSAACGYLKSKGFTHVTDLGAYSAVAHLF